MSTYWYFECLDHDPPIRSGEEFTQHTGDSAYKAGIAMANASTIPDAWSTDDYYGNNARRFLRAHPECEIGLVNEYGEHRPLPGREESMTPYDMESAFTALGLTEGERAGYRRAAAMLAAVGATERQVGVFVKIVASRRLDVDAMNQLAVSGIKLHRYPEGGNQ